jgi:tetratricopeptide (TPR) repeat protein
VRELERSAEQTYEHGPSQQSHIDLFFDALLWRSCTGHRSPGRSPPNGTHGASRVINVVSRADTRPLHKLLQELVADDPPTAEYLAEQCFWLGVLERDPEAAGRALALATRGKKDINATSNGDVPLSHSFWEGLVARMKGDTVAARDAFVAARAEQEELVRAQPDVGLQLSALGLIDAYLGRKEEALREARQAVALSPLAKNSLDGGDALYCFAVICALTGERDLAFQQLEVLAKIPAGTTYGDLRLNPYWDSLRDDPRFERIVASLAPREIAAK